MKSTFDNFRTNHRQLSSVHAELARMGITPGTKGEKGDSFSNRLTAAQISSLIFRHEGARSLFGIRTTVNPRKRAASGLQHPQLFSRPSALPCCQAHIADRNVSPAAAFPRTIWPSASPCSRARDRRADRGSALPGEGTGRPPPDPSSPADCTHGGCLGGGRCLPRSCSRRQSRLFPRG